MSTAEHGHSPDGAQLDGLSAAWLGRAELGAQPAFSAMVEALRGLQDQVTGCAPPDPVLAEATRQLTELTRQLAKYAVDERGQIAGHLAGVPGRGQALTPPIHVEETAPGRIRARVTFGRYYLGGNGAVHGGAIPLVFDELMGGLANIDRSPARTAYLHINYRNITPIETPLTVEAHLAAEDGRKRHMRAVLRSGTTLCADAEALFVALRPGQP